MGELILCHGKIAALPYYMEDASLNIYSLEELCYYLDTYTDRLEENFFRQELFAWLEHELKLKELAEKLSSCVKAGGKMAEAMDILLHACGYLSEQECQRILAQLRELDGKDEFERGKIRADRCLKNQRYAESILEYRKLIHKAAEAGAQAKDVGNIWHNMGVACANMFLYAQAAECFEEAYKYNNQQESLLEMYFAGQCAAGNSESQEYEPPQEWRQQVAERLQQVADEIGENTNESPGEEQLELWKKKYRLYSRL